MKIFLLNPPAKSGKVFIREGRCMQRADSWATPWPPITLAILAAMAGRNDDVRLIDYAVESEDEAGSPYSVASAMKPDAAVIATGFPSIEDDASAALEIKKASPETVVIGIGPFFTLLGKRALEEYSGFDIGIKGEPEASFGLLLDNLRNGVKPNVLPGLILREGGSVREGPPARFIEKPDSLPFPARSLLKNDRYILPHNGKTFTLINSARGCPGNCSFCITPKYYGLKMRRRSTAGIMREILESRDVFGIDTFLFWEETFTRDREAVLELCRELGSLDPVPSWAATTRADSIDSELAGIMHRAGCFMLGFGVESGVPEILERAGKNQHPDQVRRAVSVCKEAGILTMGHFIFGLPGETRETMKRTIRFGLSLGLDFIQVYPAVPYPGIPLGEEAFSRNWVRSRNWKDFDLGGASIMDTGFVSPEEIDIARKTFFRKFYMRPGFLARHAMIFSVSPGRLRRLGGFLKWAGLKGRGTIFGRSEETRNRTVEPV